MAFPWAVLRDASLATGNIVEDLQMGIDLTLAGHPPILCPAARVTGILPNHASAAVTQRTRWEHGHLNAIVTQFPRLLIKGLLGGNVSTLAVALEISVPPISFLVASWFILSLAALGLAGWLHQFVPVFVVAAGWVVLGTGVLFAWARFGHDLISFSTMLSIPFYVLRKLPLYRAFLQKRQTSWVRTAREGELASATLPQRVAEELIGSPANHGVGGDAEVALPAKPARVRIGHADIDNLTMDEAIVHIDHLIRLGKPAYVVTPNVDHVVQLDRDERLRRVYDEAALILCDGMPLLWASHYLKTPIKQRVAGSDLFPRLCETAAHKGYRVFFLGGRAGAGEKAIEILSARHPGFGAQCYCPPMGFEKDPAENAKIIQMIHDYRPQILCVGLGAPSRNIGCTTTSMRSPSPSPSELGHRSISLPVIRNAHQC